MEPRKTVLRAECVFAKAEEFDARLEPLKYAFLLEAASQVDAPRPLGL